MTTSSGRPGGDGQADRIELRGIRTVGTHGVLAEERRRPQPFELDLDLTADLATAEQSDRLEDTVDYSAVTDAAVAVVAGPTSFSLLEALAGEVANAVLAIDPRIVVVGVAVRKLRAPLAADVSSVGVRITRIR